ncbi:MAG: M6 family metalloprotease domain-containing protein [Paludibacteraceae bacterium]|nr:M6 family metalloprotease domain-containing protein [Paludibacteraceae bacterium]
MKKIGLIAVLSVMVCSAWAIPARRGGIVKTQPDGSQITVYQHGDEHFRWMTNTKGEWLKVDENGFYQVTEALSAEEIRTKQMAAPSRVAQAQKVATPLNIAPRGLVILVNFTDVAFTTDKAEMDSMLIGKNYTRDYSYNYGGRKYFVTSEGSAWKYFYDSSNGQYSPQFDVVGPVTVSKNMDYYGKYNEKKDFDNAPWDMVKEACELVDDSVDFSLYDNDNDGYIDFVYVIYAGYGEADGGAENTIWPHSYWLLDAGVTCKVDGKYVDLYACGNELDYFTKQHTGIGTFCHEFSHVLGLPDLYTTEGQTHKTLGSWDILDYGPYNNDMNTPPAYSAYERFMMGWLMPELIVDTANITLQDLKESNRALLISSSDEHNLIGNDPKPTNFYLLENRQQKSWDEYLPGHGMMLTKIQYSYRKWDENTVNNTAKSMGVDLIEADGMTPNSKQNGYDGKPGDLFPAGATEYLGITDHSIEQVREKDGVIYFKYKGGVDDPDFDFETAVEEVATATQVIAIYNILGQKQMTTDIEGLPHGTYVVVTSKGNHKIVR